MMENRMEQKQQLLPITLKIHIWIAGSTEPILSFDFFVPEKYVKLHEWTWQWKGPDSKRTTRCRGPPKNVLMLLWCISVGGL